MNFEIFQKNLKTIDSHKLNDLFGSQVNYLFLNSRLEDSRVQQIKSSLHLFFDQKNTFPISNSFFLIPTSGSTSFDLKLVVLEKNAVLASAKRVGVFFNFQKNQNWLLTLPSFHIGGLSVLARAFTFDQKVFTLEKWSATEFHHLLTDLSIHHASLVPTQIYDLVTQQIPAPNTIKSIFVGGGFLAKELFEKAQSLGWPIIKTFGMTETASMVAYSNTKQDSYTFFPHCHGLITSAGRLAITCDSLFQGYLIESKKDSSFYFHSHKQDMQNGYWITQDLAELKNDQLFLKGRELDIIKIHGELVNLNNIRKSFNEFASSLLANHSAIIAIPNLRSENELLIIIETIESSKEKLEIELQKALVVLNKKLLPFEKIKSYLFIDKLERTELGKIKYTYFESFQFKELMNENKQNFME